MFQDEKIIDSCLRVFDSLSESLANNTNKGVAKAVSDASTLFRSEAMQIRRQYVIDVLLGKGPVANIRKAMGVTSPYKKIDLLPSDYEDRAKYNTMVNELISEFTSREFTGLPVGGLFKPNLDFKAGVLPPNWTGEDLIIRGNALYATETGMVLLAHVKTSWCHHTLALNWTKTAERDKYKFSMDVYSHVESEAAVIKHNELSVFHDLAKLRSSFIMAMKSNGYSIPTPIPISELNAVASTACELLEKLKGLENSTGHGVKLNVDNVSFIYDYKKPLNERTAIRDGVVEDVQWQYLKPTKQHQIITLLKIVIEKTSIDLQLKEDYSEEE